MAERPRIDRIVIDGHAACTAEEAAAAIVAVERFLADNRRPQQSARVTPESGWARAGREQAIGGWETPVFPLPEDGNDWLEIRPGFATLT